MSVWLWVMLGGALGAASRFALTALVRADLHSGFPTGTLIANLLGCLLIGIAATLLEPLNQNYPALRLTFIVGFLGGFTTFSSFGIETVQLVQNEHYGAAVSYVLASNVFGLCLVGLGMWAAKVLRHGN